MIIFDWGQESYLAPNDTAVMRQKWINKKLRPLNIARNKTLFCEG